MLIIVVFDEGSCGLRLGDFNATLNVEDSSMGSSKITQSMREFKDCVEQLEVMDINCSGFHYTWTQKPKNGTGILRKIDRIMGNVEFITMFLKSFAIFQPYHISDYTPCIVKLHSVVKEKPKPFKFSNFIVHKKGLFFG